MERLSKSGGIDPEFKWVQKTEEGAQDFESGHFTAAADKWETAHGFTHGFDPGDPRRASSLNNLAIAFRIRQNFKEAEDLYQSALEDWQSGLHWVKSMRLEQRARSSLFHLRMELKHRKKYDDMARRKYEELLHGGRAATLNNLAELYHRTDRIQDARRLYREALRERSNSMPERGDVATIIQHNLSSLSEKTVKPPDSIVPSYDHLKKSMLFIPKAERNGWIVDKPPEFTDEGRLMAAILLMHLIDHTYLSSSNL
jgi:tetratricopeptide (TPR) repeat protein